MPRTSIAAVMGIIETDPNIVGSSGAKLQPFIDAANLMVTNVCVNLLAAGDSDGTPYDDPTLEMIERYLAAHEYAKRDFNNQVISEKAGDASQTFAAFGSSRGYNSTRWGQTALDLDWQGCLAAQQARQDKGVPVKPGIIHLGKRRNSRDPD